MIDSEFYGPMNVDEAAKYLRIATSTLYKLVHFKKIPYNKPNGLLRFYKDELDTYVRSGRVLADFEVSQKAENLLIKTNV